MKQTLIGIAIALAALVALVALGALVVGTGIYNVAADEEHTAPVYRLLETARERSVAVRASDITVPSNLADPERIRRGAGNYDSMCVGCHLGPQAKETELSRGLYPEPPALAKARATDPARTFWVIKHGIKSTAMPAWGKSMEDQYIWDMVAFIRKLPEMSAEDYVSTVRASGGHSHGGTESTDQQSQGKREHGHDDGENASQHKGGEHTHESGEEHSHSH